MTTQIVIPEGGRAFPAGRNLSLQCFTGFSPPVETPIPCGPMAEGFADLVSDIDLRNFGLAVYATNYRAAKTKSNATLNS